MLKSQNEFRERFVTRRNTGKPDRMTTLAQSIPRSPIYHFLLPNDQLGPTPTDLIVSAITTTSNDLAISVSQVIELPNEPKDTMFARKLNNADTLIRTYYKQQRNFSRVFDLESSLKKNTPLIINYQLLPELYPVRLRNQDTYRWVELQWWRAIWDTVKSINTSRMQFVSAFTPRQLKPQEYYYDLLRNNKLVDLRKIRNREDLILLDIFGFYTGLKEQTVIGDVVRSLYPTLFLDDYKPQNDNKPNGPEIILALRDGTNVVYLDLYKFTEWALTTSSTSAKMDWIYSLFEAQVEKRIVVESIEDKTYYDEVVRLKEKVAQDTPVGVVDDVANAVLKEADALLASGAITEGEYKGNVRLAGRFKTMIDPLSGDLVANTLVRARLSDNAVASSTVPDMKIIDDKSYLANNVKNNDAKYINEHLNDDIITTIMGLQKEGIIITNLKVARNRDAVNDTTNITFQTKPIKGDISSSVIVYPTITSAGTLLSGGVEYRMNKQRGELPIVKIAPDTVALGSDMGKMFVRRGFLETDNVLSWYVKNINVLHAEKKITDKANANVSVIDHDLEIPEIYSAMSYRFRRFTCEGINFSWDYANRQEIFKLSDAEIKKIEKHSVVCGMYGKDYVTVGEGDLFYVIKNNKPELLGKLEDVLGIDAAKKPIEWAGVTVKSKVFPVGAILAYWMGIEAFFKYIGVRVKEYEPNARMESSEGILIKFRDCKVMVSYDDKLQELLVGGFKYFKEGLKTVNYEDLNKRNNWNPVFSSRGLGNSQIKELTRIERSWLDAITVKNLESMPEPTEIIPLMVRSVELLTNRQYNEEADGIIKINRGYDRINAIIHRELMAGVRELNRGNITAKRTFSINPNAVMLKIITDEGVSPVEQTNPQQVSGEQDRITYAGVGGRSNRTLVGRHRKFTRNDMGIISEGFTDSGKAGTIMYYTNNPNVKNIYGRVDSNADKKLGNLVSSTTLLSPFSLFDDPKRINFARIQLDAWMAAIGHQALPLRTTFELVVAHRCGEGYTLISEDEGRVTLCDENAIVIAYKNGTDKVFKLGRTFGKAAGKVFPRSLVTDRAAGYKFKAGEVLAWDESFFYRDWIESTQVGLYTGVPAITAMMETPVTYEDGTGMSSKFAKRMGSRISYIRDMLVGFEESIDMLVKVGDHVSSEDTLASILPAGVTVDPDDSLSIDYLSTTSPGAKYPGVIEKIEVLYCGDLETCTESVRKQISMGDRQRTKESKLTGDYPTGLISKPTYIGKNYVGQNKCLIRVYLTHEDEVTVGSKYALCNSLKTVPGEIFDTIFRTIDGQEIDIKTSYKGIMARIVKSPEYMGVINMVVRQIGFNAVKLY